MKEMAKVEPLQPADLPELRQFLIEGFGVRSNCPYFTEDALRWKYFEDYGVPGPRSLVSRVEGRITGHIGLCLRSFLIPAEPDRETTTLHTIDWLASPQHPSVGVCLMLKALERAETQYAVGGSPLAQHALQSLRFEPLTPVKVYRRVLRPLRRLRESSQGLLRRQARLARDLAYTLYYRPRPPRNRLLWSPVQQFGAEVYEVLSAGPRKVVGTSRTPELLNYYLRYPGESVSGWTLGGNQAVQGFALLSMTRGEVRPGKIIECYVGSEDPALWHAAYASLMDYFREASADYVTAFASTPWAQQALHDCGFHLLREHGVQLRDPRKRIPRDLPFHLGMLEGDNALLS